MWMTYALQGVAWLLDMLTIFFAFWAAYELRYTYRIGAFVPVEQDTLGFNQWARHAMLAIAFTLVIFFARGVYQVRRRLTVGDYIPLVTSSYGMAIACVILFAFFVQFSPSRAVYIYVAVMGTALMLLHRGLAERLRTKLYARGIGVERAVVVGDSESARRLAQTLKGQPGWGYQLVGIVSDHQEPSVIAIATESGIQTTPYLGEVRDLDTVVDHFRIAEVFIVESDHSDATIERMIESCRALGVQFRMVPRLLQMTMDRVDITEINGIPLVGVRDASIRGWNAIVKRMVDICLSLGTLIVVAIPALVIAFMVRRDSAGPAFYRQTRVGQYGKPFQMIKFRTMVTNADDLREQVITGQGVDVRLFKDQHDPRVTSIGTWLRRYSIDELPQVWNVLVGDMTFVGPRPPLPSEVEEYAPWHWQRLLIRPGMTGLWQVNGRSDLSFDQMVRLDLYYAENWSPWLDLKIAARTIPAVLFGRGAY